MVIIQSVAHNELVADVHAFVVDGIVVLEVVRFEEERGDAHIGGLQVPKFLYGVSHRVACVDDVFHDDHMPSVQGMVQADELADDVGGFRARVGSEFDEADFTGDGQSLEQFGGKHESAVEYHEKQRVHAVQVAVDLVSNVLDAGFDFFLGDVEPKFLV